MKDGEQNIQTDYFQILALPFANYVQRDKYLNFPVCVSLSLKDKELFPENNWESVVVVKIKS